MTLGPLVKRTYQLVFGGREQAGGCAPVGACPAPVVAAAGWAPGRDGQEIAGGAWAGMETCGWGASGSGGSGLEFSARPAQAGIACKSQAATISAEKAEFLLRAQPSLHPLAAPRRFVSSLEPLSKKNHLAGQSSAAHDSGGRPARRLTGRFRAKRIQRNAFLAHHQALTLFSGKRSSPPAAAGYFFKFGTLNSHIDHCGTFKPSAIDARPPAPQTGNELVCSTLFARGVPSCVPILHRAPVSAPAALAIASKRPSS